ncbi:MAG: hypothetical protein ABI877_09640 [Gemmatimonadaceae bacterium]
MRVRDVSVILALVATPLAAQAQSNTAIGVFAGGTVPMSNYKDVAKTGWNLGGYIDFGRGDGPVGFRLDGSYNGFGDKDVITSSGGTTNITISNKYSLLNANMNLVVGVPASGSPIRPYLIGGAGVYYLKNAPRCVAGTACGSLTLSDESVTKLGVNGGGGLEFGVRGISVFAEARYHYVFDAIPKLSCIGQSGCAKSAAQLVPLTIGLTFRP